MRVELHCHSTRSDGSDAPADVGAQCLMRGVNVFSLTDHDTCRGSSEAAAAFGGPFIRGVELSCIDNHRTVHLLVYDVAGDQRWEEFERYLEEASAARQQRVRRICARLEQAGVPIDLESILVDGDERSVGRPDIARALVRSGAVRSVSEAFSRYLGDGKQFDEPLARLSVGEGIELGRQVGARIALAHPHTLGTRAEGLLREHKTAGLTGLEVYYGLYGKKQRQAFRSLARQLGLVATAGSDYHGTGSPQVERPGVDIGDDVAAPLLDWLEIAI